MKKQYLGLALLAFLLIGSVLVSAQLFGTTPAAQDSSSAQRTVTVTGSYKTQVSPDQAQFSVSVQTQEKTAKASVDANSALANKVIGALKAAGIDAQDIQTQGFNTYQKQECASTPSGTTAAVYPLPPCKTQVVGWVTTNTVVVTTTNLDKVGSYIDAASSAGATGFSGLSFGLTTQKQQQIESELLQGAAKNAKDKAQTLASALGAHVGQVMTISESSSSPVPVIYAARAAPLESAPAPTPVEPGQVSVSKDVTVSFALQ